MSIDIMESVITPIVRPAPANRSESIAKLVSALSKAQGQIEGAKKDSDNPYFKSKYADLASVWDACRQPLSQNELAVIQTVDDSTPDGRVCVETLLAHSSGEWISHRIRMKPAKDDPQAIGSAITYARRYGLQSIVGIAPEDDDGNAASGKNTNLNVSDKEKVTNKSRQSSTIGAPAATAHAPSEPVHTSKGDPAYITEPQLKRFIAICGSRQWTEEEVKKLLMEFGVFTRAKILKSDYDKICKIIESHDYSSYLDAKNNPPAKAV